MLYGRIFVAHSSCCLYLSASFTVSLHLAYTFLFSFAVSLVCFSPYYLTHMLLYAFLAVYFSACFKIPFLYIGVLRTFFRLSSLVRVSQFYCVLRVLLLLSTSQFYCCTNELGIFCLHIIACLHTLTTCRFSACVYCFNTNVRRKLSLVSLQCIFHNSIAVQSSGRACGNLQTFQCTIGGEH